jgi:hypothetical protein
MLILVSILINKLSRRKINERRIDNEVSREDGIGGCFDLNFRRCGNGREFDRN